MESEVTDVTEDWTNHREARLLLISCYNNQYYAVSGRGIELFSCSLRVDFSDVTHVAYGFL